MQGTDTLIKRAQLTAEIKHLENSIRRHHRIIGALQVRGMDAQDKLNKLEKMEGEK